MHNYTWSTDAASGEFEAADLGEAIVRLTAEREWPAIDGAKEQREIDNGAWLYVREDGVEILRRGKMP